MNRIPDFGNSTVTSQGNITELLGYLLPLVAGIIFLVAGGIIIRYAIKGRIGGQANNLSRTHETEWSTEMTEMDRTNSDPIAIEETLSSSTPQIPNEVMEQLKTYIQEMIEASKQEAEVHLTSAINRTAVGITNHMTDLNISEQLNAICDPQFIINPSFLTVGARIGFGQFGMVFRGTLRTNDDGLPENVAIKVVQRIRSEEEVVRAFLREVNTLQFAGTNHENIVRFLGACCYNGK